MAVQTEADWADEGFRLVGERMEIAAERTVFNADESIRQARLALESKQAAGDIAAAFKGEQARELGLDDEFTPSEIARMRGGL